MLRFYDMRPLIDKNHKFTIFGTDNANAIGSVVVDAAKENIARAHCRHVDVERAGGAVSCWFALFSYRKYSAKTRTRRWELRYECIFVLVPVMPGGNFRVKVLLEPGSDWIVSAARWRLAICLTMARPRPVPPSSRERAVSTR